MSEKKNFVLVDKKGNDLEPIQLFSGRQPRQAALKVANRGVKDIRLRERGTNKIHVFTGSKKTVDAPKNRPDWLPAKISKPFVKKVGIERKE